MKATLLKKGFSFFAVMMTLLTGEVQARSSAEEVFTHIYLTNAWGTNSNGECSSGSGSTLENTVTYRDFLQDFLNVYDIHSVVDAGCGDWGHSHAINWDGIEYKGYDVVKVILERVRGRYSAPNINFIHGDILWTDLPKADLLICKDVLEHLSNEDISLFLKQLPKYKFCLITNDIDVHTQTSTNPDTYMGGYHVIDLTQPPFNLAGIKALTYGNYPYLKQTLLLINEKEFVTPLLPGE